MFTKYIDPSTLDFSAAFQVKKIAPIKARPATTGEKIATVMKDGYPETLNVTEAGDWIITNPSGEEYIVSDFVDRYDPSRHFSGMYVKKESEKFVYAESNVKFMAAWGKVFNLKKGGAIVKKKAGGFYGIQPEELNNPAIYEILK